MTQDSAGDDAALRSFLTEQNSTWRFHLVHLGATFRPGDDEYFEQAWLSVTLIRDDSGRDPAPIIWSLIPQRAQHPVKFSRSLKIGAKLGFDASVEVKDSGQRTEVFLETYGLQESNCVWEFIRTSQDEISGTQRLALVSRIPQSVAVTGTVELKATLARKRLGIFTYRATRDSGDRISFALR